MLSLLLGQVFLLYDPFRPLGRAVKVPNCVSVCSLAVIDGLSRLLLQNLYWITFFRTIPSQLQSNSPKTDDLF
ncbi:hypothetical protein BD560DRAFT_393205 [Blakeslea trispora]|nr:hypothetical protein BD560DRAFT_393205 [Blakeslea trispora]